MAPGDTGVTGPKQLNIAVCGGLNWDLIMIAPQIPISGECLNAEKFEEFPGGKGGNAAIALYRLTHIRPATEPTFTEVDMLLNDENGSNSSIAPEPENAFEGRLPKVEVRMIGAIGIDASDNRRGLRMKNWLRHNWIKVDLIREIAGERSATAFSMVEGDTGANRALIYPGANHLPSTEDFRDIGALGSPKPDLIVLELEMNRKTVSKILSLAREAGIETLLNPAPAHYLSADIYRGITHLVVNETEAAIMSGQPSDAYTEGCDDWNIVTDYFLDLGVENVVVTLEDKGAFFSLEKGKGFPIPAVEVPQEKILDTAGAGCVTHNSFFGLLLSTLVPSIALILVDTSYRDTFVGAYATEWLRQKYGGVKWNPEIAVKRANRAAAMIIQKVGCQEAIPWASDVEEAMPSNAIPKVELNDAYKGFDSVRQREQ